MPKFIPKGKLSKKAQKEINRQRRATWGFSPVTKTVGSKKVYSRKKKVQDPDNYGLSFFSALPVFFPDTGSSYRIPSVPQRIISITVFTFSVQGSCLSHDSGYCA